MKKAAHLFVAAVVLAIGCFVGHRYHAQERYDLAWQAGNANGWASAVKFIAPGIGREGVEEKPAGGGIVEID